MCALACQGVTSDFDYHWQLFFNSFIKQQSFLRIAFMLKCVILIFNNNALITIYESKLCTVCSAAYSSLSDNLIEYSDVYRNYKRLLGY